jgi:hypothetical protein
MTDSACTLSCFDPDITRFEEGFYNRDPCYSLDSKKNDLVALLNRLGMIITPAVYNLTNIPTSVGLAPAQRQSLVITPHHPKLSD